MESSTKLILGGLAAAGVFFLLTRPASAATNGSANAAPPQPAPLPPLPQAVVTQVPDPSAPVVVPFSNFATTPGVNAAVTQAFNAQQPSAAVTSAIDALDGGNTLTNQPLQDLANAPTEFEAADPTGTLDANGNLI